MATASFKFPGVRQLTAYAVSFAPLYAACFASFAAFVWSELFLHPRLSKQFRTDDPAISKSYVPQETVTNAQCLAIAFPLPVVVLSWWCWLGRDALVENRYMVHSYARVRKPEWVPARWHLYHASCVVLVLVLGINGVLTNGLKLAITNARPDFLARCKPVDPTAPYVGYDQCSQSDKWILYEGLKSTPSGHSSFAAAGLGFLYVWQTHHTRVSRVRHFWCPALCFLVMVSRVVDHRHHWYDVLAGAALGAAVSGLAWTKWMREEPVEPVLPV
ncbi:LADA_0H01640g1_1 [Lachancea dasiensis]|uniref:LADA_0H01640g1_1 n=1 Tax=Lachancea dasiensis TaxID=1072105 RepID=A0A1G4JZA9_9SACH|nr:LADA_0H01640g1_1 [Lachancea dasiensis]